MQLFEEFNSQKGIGRTCIAPSKDSAPLAAHLTLRFINNSI